MAYPNAPVEGGGAKLHPLYDDNAGTKRTNAWRGYKSGVVDGDRLAEAGVYPTSGSCVTGRKTTSSAAATQLTTTSIPCQGMLVKASLGNSDAMWVGISTVTANSVDATDGYPLAPGESVGVPCRNANEIYIRREGAINVQAHWMASAD